MGKGMEKFNLKYMKVRLRTRNYYYINLNEENISGKER